MDIIIVIMLIQLLFTQSPEWVYQYIHPSYTDEWPAALIIDHFGNSYTTGVICSDDTTGGHLTGIGVVKLNVSGQERWIYFNDTMGRLNYGYDIACKNNQIYVTGYFQSATEMRCVTLCIDTAKNERWLSIDTLAYGRGAAIVLDSASGVYTAGMIYGLATDIRVIKYDTLGNVCWRYVYDGPASSYDDAADIVADRWCNVYVGGYSTGNSTSTDFTVIKLDSAGNEKWVYRYDGPAHGRDEIEALDIDTMGNIYITGKSVGNNWDYCVIKIDTAGHEKWVYRYDGLAGVQDTPYDLAVDHEGNVYVCGISIDDTLGLFTVIKLDTIGNEIWKYKSTGSGWGGGAVRIALDGIGGVYCAGGFGNNQNRGQIALVKLNPDGDTAWTYLHPHSPVPPNTDATRDLAIDSSGNVYLTGFINISQWNNDITVMKFGAGVGIKEVGYEIKVSNPREALIERGGITFAADQDAECFVYDALGRRIIHNHVLKGMRYYILIPMGVYFVRLRSGGEVKQQKIVIVN